MPSLSEDEIDDLRRDVCKDLLNAYRRYEATGRLPEGINLARLPSLPPNATADDHFEYNQQRADVLRALAERIIGQQGKPWDYEIVIRNGVQIHLDLKYRGNRDANIRDIKTSRVWTGERE